MATGLHIESTGPNAADLHELIRHRAEEIYYRSRCVPGRDMENWAQAEKEINDEVAAQAARRKAIVIRVSGTLYVGEYADETSHGYIPGEFAKGQPVPVRIDGDKMFVKRPNGTELATTVVKKIANTS